MFCLLYQVTIDNIQPLIISLLLLSKTHNINRNISYIPTNEGLLENEPQGHNFIAR